MFHNLVAAAGQKDDDNEDIEETASVQQMRAAIQRGRSSTNEETHHSDSDEESAEEGEDDNSDNHEDDTNLNQDDDDASEIGHAPSGDQQSGNTTPHGTNLHALAVAACHGGSKGHASATAVHQQDLAVAVLNQQMESSGMRETDQQEKDRCAVIVRTLIFKKMKFLMPDQMSSNGKVATRVYKYMNYKDEPGFKEDWDLWIGKHVRNIINEKRSAITQAVHKSIVRGKEALASSCFGGKQIEC